MGREAGSHRLVAALVELGRGTVVDPDGDLLHTLLRQAAQTSGMRFALLAECLDTPPTRARTLAYWSGDRFVENIEYDLGGTPCEEVAKGAVCFYAEGVQQRFPGDDALRELGVEGYVGLPLVEPDGSVLGYIALLHDEPIADDSAARPLLEACAERATAELSRGRAYEALRLSEERYRLLADNAQDLIAETDATGTLLYVSPSHRELLGYEPAELLGRNMIEFAHPEELDDLLPALARAVETGTLERRSYRCRHRDGSWIWVEAIARAFRGADGETRIGIVGRDTTEHRRAEARLLASERRFRAFAEEADDLICELSGEGRFLYVNPGFRRVLGWSTEELLGRSPWEFLYGDVARKAEAAFPRGPSHQRSQRMLVQFRRRDGGCVWLDAGGTFYSNAEGETRIVGIARDVTRQLEAQAERRRVDERIQRAQKLEGLSVLAGGIAHDFNNLLVAILGNADLALSLPDASPAVRTELEQIQSASIRAADLARQMLAYAGKGRLVSETFDLSGLVRETAQLIAVSVERRANLHYDFAKDPLPVEGDPTQIRQVVLNLITNAAEAIHDEPGLITVRTAAASPGPELAEIYLDEALPGGAYGYVEVVDTGGGMDDATRERIFDPFFTTKFAGRGLGLAAVIGILRAHGGVIRVDSAPGQGTRVRAFLPLDARGAPAAATPDESPDEAKREATVLVVDDEECVRRVARRMLEANGFAVLTANHGREALEVLEAHAVNVSIVLLDKVMPEMDGEVARRAMLERWPELPVVLSSGYDEADTARRFAAHSLTAFVQKPYRSADLLEQIDALLRAQAGSAPAG